MITGAVIIDLQGPALLPEEHKLLQHPNTAGVLLFTRNFKSVNQLNDLVSNIRLVAEKPLLIMVDHEGGRVWRFDTGFSKLPPAAHFGQCYEKQPQLAKELAYKAGCLMAGELLNCDIDLSLAPVLDINNVSQVIGDRAFHSAPEIVKVLAEQFIAGMNATGMSACGKHFPGHGSCVPDTHLASAEDQRSYQEILEQDMLPFVELLPRLSAIMPAHVVYPAIDSVPVGFSKQWLQKILRKTLGFNGVIISDCLSMQAATMAGDDVLRAELALDAGCDLIIFAQQTRERLLWILEQLHIEKDQAHTHRLTTLQGTRSGAPTESTNLQEITEGLMSV